MLAEPPFGVDVSPPRRCPITSLRVRAITPWMTSLMFPRSFRDCVFLTRRRIRSRISRVRSPFSTISSKACRAFSRSGGCARSRRNPAPALVTAAAIGWLTSWAIEAVSCPMVATRVACVSAICISLNASADRLRLVRSSTNPIPWSLFSSNAVTPIRTRMRLPSLRNQRFGKTGWWRQSHQTGCSPRSHVEPVSEEVPGTEILDAETGRENPPFRPGETSTETREYSKSPGFGGIARQKPDGVRSLRLDGGRDRDRTCDPLDVNEVLSR
jgi:hypothetical protein